MNKLKIKCCSYYLSLVIYFYLYKINIVNVVLLSVADLSKECQLAPGDPSAVVVLGANLHSALAVKGLIY